MFVLASTAGFLIDVEQVWTTKYETDQSHVRTRNQARLWAVMVGLFQCVGIVLIWGFARAAARVYIDYRSPLAWIDIALPGATWQMIWAVAWGWTLLLLVPVECWVLFRLRLRGGVYGWYAEMLNGLVMLLLVVYGGSLALGAVAPFVPIGMRLE
jgi:hypothetical protein